MTHKNESCETTYTPIVSFEICNVQITVSFLDKAIVSSGNKQDNTYDDKAYYVWPICDLQ